MARPSRSVGIVPHFLVIFAKQMMVGAGFVVCVTMRIEVFFQFRSVISCERLACFFYFGIVKVVRRFSVAIARGIDERPSTCARRANFRRQDRGDFRRDLSALRILANSERVRLFERFPRDEDICTWIEDPRSRQDAFYGDDVDMARA